MANLCVGALVRFIQATPECSFVSSSGTAEGVIGYADDLALHARSPAALHLMLNQLARFCALTGLELSLKKSVLTGYDVKVGEGLRPYIEYKEEIITCLAARKRPAAA